MVSKKESWSIFNLSHEDSLSSLSDSAPGQAVEPARHRPSRFEESQIIHVPLFKTCEGSNRSRREDKPQPKLPVLIFSILC